MNRSGSLLLLTSLALSSCCERKLYPVSLPDAPEPSKPTSSGKLSVTLLPGEQPDGNPGFLPVTKKATPFSIKRHLQK